MDFTCLLDGVAPIKKNAIILKMKDQRPVGESISL
jgi:hypothetical protein